MSKNEETPKKKARKTRLKGTPTQKPCRVVKRDGTVLGCLKTKDRFTDFKPRWAGCAEHISPKGRRFFQVGCDACAALVNGNIRQPYCIECDKTRPKKRKTKAKAAAAPTPTPVVETSAEQRQRYEESGKEALAAVVLVPETPVPVAALPAVEPLEVKPLPEPEPVVVEAQAEPSPESVKLPDPVVERPAIANTADLLKLFGGSND